MDGNWWNLQRFPISKDLKYIQLKPSFKHGWTLDIGFQVFFYSSIDMEFSIEEKHLQVSFTQDPMFKRKYQRTSLKVTLLLDYPPWNWRNLVTWIQGTHFKRKGGAGFQPSIFSSGPSSISRIHVMGIFTNIKGWLLCYFKHPDPSLE